MINKIKNVTASLWQDLRFALRHITHQPGIWLLASLTLGLGIGANLALYGIARPVLLSPLPYTQAQDLVYVNATNPSNNTPYAGFSIPDYHDMRRDMSSLTDLAAYATRALAIRVGDSGAERVTTLQATYNLADILDIQPQAGRWFVESDDQIGAARVVILSDHIWRDRFARSPDALGQNIVVDGSIYQIIGVMPSTTGLELTGAVWLPLHPQQAEFVDIRGVHIVTSVGRLASGSSLLEANQQARVLAAQLEADYPDDNTGRGAVVTEMHDFLVRNVRQPLTLMSVLMGTVLLLACVNVLMLLLVRGSVRMQELGIRSALGATTGRLLRQLVSEQLWLAVGSSACGLLIAWLVLSLLGQSNLWGNSVLQQPLLDSNIILLSAGIGLLLSIIVGVAPAIMLSLNARQGPTQARSKSAAGGGNTRALLVSIQLSFAFALSAVALIVAQSYLQTINIHPGFAGDQVIKVEVNLPASDYPFPGTDVFPDWPEVQQLLPQLMQAVNAVPGVQQATIAQNHPLQPGWTTTVRVPDQPLITGETGAAIEWSMRGVMPGYFQINSIPLLAGRDVNNFDRVGSQPVAVINRAAAERWFLGEDPIGKNINFFSADRQVIGVVDNVRFNGLNADYAPAVYPPMMQAPFSGFSILASTSGNNSGVIKALQEAIWSVEPNATLFRAEPLNNQLNVILQPRKLVTSIVLLIALFALVLALSGIYGMVAFEVQHRRAEIGLRRALGATAARVVMLAMRRSLWLMLIGCGVGLLLALGSERILSSYLTGLSLNSPVVLLFAVGLFCLMAGIASWVPAQRATRITPTEALRYE